MPLFDEDWWTFQRAFGIHPPSADAADFYIDSGDGWRCPCGRYEIGESASTPNVPPFRAICPHCGTSAEIRPAQ